MARPSRSAAAITSSSRTDPPGWMNAVAPCFAASSTPSGNGKNASDADHRAGQRQHRLHGADLDRIHPAHLPRADAHRLARRARTRWRSTSRAWRPSRRTRARSIPRPWARAASSPRPRRDPDGACRPSAPESRRRCDFTTRRSVAGSHLHQPQVLLRRRIAQRFGREYPARRSLR